MRLPRRPPHVQGEARKEWTRIGRKLAACGLMTEIDGAALALYCQAWARWVDAEEKLSKFGVVISAPSGFLVQSPFLAIANKAMDQMTRLLTEFGMSPSSRVRVAAMKPARASVPLRRSEEDDPRKALRVVQ